MKPHKLALLGGVLLLVVAATACSRLKARDHLNKGVAAFRNAQFQQAIMHFKTAVDLDPRCSMPACIWQRLTLSSTFPAAILRTTSRLANRPLKPSKTS